MKIIYCKDCAKYSNGRRLMLAYIMDGYYKGAEKREPDDFCSKAKKRNT